MGTAGESDPNTVRALYFHSQFCLNSIPAGLLCWRHWLATPALCQPSFFPSAQTALLLQDTVNSMQAGDLQLYSLFPRYIQIPQQLAKHLIWPAALPVTRCLTMVTLQEFKRKETKKKIPKGMCCWTRDWRRENKDLKDIFWIRCSVLLNPQFKQAIAEIIMHIARLHPSHTSR